MGSSRSGLIDSVAHATHVASYLAASFPQPGPTPEHKTANELS